MFDDFLRDLPEADRRAVEQIINRVRGHVPDAEEGNSYGMPAFRYLGKPLLGFKAAKNHLTLAPFSAEVVDAVKDRLAGFALSKGTIRFTGDHPVPDAVVTLMVDRRIAEITRYG
jgi:uncharacterized protein YdhG (YjbR/CyaY superfamily)